MKQLSFWMALKIGKRQWNVLTDIQFQSAIESALVKLGL